MTRNRRNWILPLAAAALLAGVAFTSSRGADSPPDQAAPGHVIFKLRAEVFHSGAYRADLAPSGRTGLTGLDSELARFQVSEIRPVFNMKVHPEPKQAMGLDRIFLARYGSAEPPRSAALGLAARAEIEWAEPDWIVSGTSTSPNDSLYYYQWAHNNHGQAIAAGGDSVGTQDCDGDTNQAWDISTGAYNVVIAVLDTGIDRGHPEFANKVLAGWDFVNNDSDPTDDFGHGTCCAGIAAARGNNGRGVAGVAWENAILPVKVLNSSNQGTNADLVAGIEYAADFGSKVISMSLASSTDSQAVHDAVNYAYSSDCVQVAAAGNANTNSVYYPAAYLHVIAVGALSPCNERKSPSSCDGEATWGSNYGTGLTLMAPGVRIHTADIRGAAGFSSTDYTASFNGTSAATPFVAGIAALVRSVKPNLTEGDVEAVLRGSCDDLGPAGWDQETGYGRVNAYVALRSITGAVFVGPNPGVQYGTYTAPYRTVAQGVSAVPTGNYVVIKPGNYDEATPMSITKVLHLDAIDGGVTVH
jgi:subtilisin family serine protease